MLCNTGFSIGVKHANKTKKFFRQENESTEKRIRRHCDSFVENRGSISKKERCEALIKSLNVARRVLKNILQRPSESKCKTLKKRVPLLQETIF
jgi:hypothetical protein